MHAPPRAESPAEDEAGLPTHAALRTVAVRAGGPLSILAAVLIVMHGFWLGDRLTYQQVDILSFWLSRWSAMGHAVAHGQVPTWLPNQFGGVPFASDPQSGWLYVPVMVLFGLLPAWRAMTLFITLQPILAGIGMWWFFRHEGLGRPAATAGGLVMALPIAGSAVGLSMPFSGMLAWTAMTLAATSGLVRARGRRAFVAWLAFAGFAWSQVAAAHLTDGLLLGTATVALYVVVRLWLQVRTGERSASSALRMALAVGLAAPLLSAAILWPRMRLLPRTSIGEGYLALGALAARLSGTRPLSPIALHGVGPWWITGFARAPGGYVGAATILLVLVAFGSRRWRWPAAAFALLGVAGWLANQEFLIGSEPVRSAALRTSLGVLWLRDPYRFRYLLLPAFSALSAYGLQSWLELPAAHGRRALLRRAGWFVAPVLALVLAPIVAGADPRGSILFVAGTALAAPLLLAAARGRRVAAGLLVAALALELSGAGLIGQGGPIPVYQNDVVYAPYDPGLDPSFPDYHAPWVTEGAYLRAGPIGRALQAEAGSNARYLSYWPRVARTRPRGFLFEQQPATWPALANGRSVLFGLDEVQGYSPVQLDRYWRLVRRIDTFAPTFYNSATFQADPRGVLDLFGVRWIVQPRGNRPPAGSRAVARQGMWTLYQLAGWQGRASIVTSWRVTSSSAALAAVVAPGFDPARTAILERAPTIGGRPLAPASAPGATGSGSSGGSPPTISYRELSPEHARVRVTTASPAVLLVRNPWDRGWQATVDGRPAPVLVADYLMQAVAIPAGTHTVDLTYHDPPVGQGAAASAVAWAGLLVALGWAWRSDRRATSSSGPSPGAGAPPR